MSNDFLNGLGYLSFATRLKRLSDNMIHDGRRMYRDLGMDIEPNWYAIFKLLGKRGAMTITEIADELGFSHPSVVNMINKMSIAGYLEAGESDGDNRKRIMRLSAKAIDKMPEFEKIWAAGTASMKRMMPAADVLELLTTLEEKIAEKGFGERTLDAYGQPAEVSIHSFAPAYAPDFASLNYEWIEETYEVEDHDREQLDHPESRIIDKGGEIFFAEVAGRIVGTVAMIPEAEDTFELAKMAVTGGYRGYGVGDELMSACIEYAKENGIERIVLDSNRKQVAAIRLYKKVGFQEIPLNPDTPFARADIRMERLTF